MHASVCLLCAGHPNSAIDPTKSVQFVGQFSWVTGDPIGHQIDSEMDVWSDVDLYCLLGVQSVADVVRHGRLRWFGHMEQTD